LIILISVITVYLVVLYPWMNRWGLTDAEVGMSLPGDDVETGTVITSTRGVTIHAPAKEVWKWLVQLGQERAGFYSNDWLENLALADIHNSNQILTEWQSRQKGDLVYGAGGVIYKHNSFWKILEYEEGKMLYLWGPIVVLPIDENTTRLYTRTYAIPASWVAQVIGKLSYDWMHFVMERGMLLGIKIRAEGNLNSVSILQVVSWTGWIAAGLGMVYVLFIRRRGWWWGLIPLAYAVTIIGITSDFQSTMAGFLWFGSIIAGFLVFGFRWWKGLALATVLVVLIFVLTPQPFLSFGLIFLGITLAILFISKRSRSTFRYS